jgi:hypothetical protein
MVRVAVRERMAFGLISGRLRPWGFQRSTFWYRDKSVTLLYCFMPDHAHAVIFGQSDEARPKAAIEGFKTSSGIWLRQHFSRVRWQVGYHDRIIRNNQEWRGHVQYGLNNPVRAGLVSRFDDYPHLGRQGMTVEELLKCW